MIKEMHYDKDDLWKGLGMIILFHNHIIILVSPKLTLKVVADDTG